MNSRDWLREAARLYGPRVFLEQGVWRWTFAEWDRRVDRVAGTLAAAGVVAGSRVASLLSGGYQAAEVVFAALRLGAVLVPMNTRLGPEELAYQWQDADPSAVVVSEELAHLLPAAAGPRLGVALGAPEDDALLGPAWRGVAGAAPTGVQSIIYTSGTTGRPKGALLTVTQLGWNAWGSMLRLGHLPDDVWLCCLPLFHVGGQAILFRAVLAGTAVRLEPRFEAQTAAAALADGSVTLASLVPTMLRRILDVHAGAFAPRLRAVLIGGGAAPKTLMAEGRRRGLPLVATYGMTETASQMATQDLRLDGEDAGARPLYGFELRIAEPGADGSGEIWVRGPGVSPGYWRRPEETAARFDADGWFATGDIGRLDSQGRVQVLDRRQDLIVSGGENVYPAEVEAALTAIRGVRAAAVVGVPDPEWGAVPAAAVVPQDGVRLDPEALTRALRRRLAAYKVPREWALVNELPLTANGKVRRQAVQAWFASRRERPR